jgi:uncharacterized protein (DUF1501 family)
MKRFTRRQFLKRSAVTAAGAAIAPHLRLLSGTNVAYAAGPSDAIVVVVQLDGGNDGLNTVYPIANGSTDQRDRYEDYRPTLKLPVTNGQIATFMGGGFQDADAFPDATSVLAFGTPGPDNASYALHPAMTKMHALYQAGKLAVVNSVHYPFPDHSHFRSDEIWNTGDPLGTGGLGWFGKYLDYAGFQPTEVPCVNHDDSIKPLFTPTDTSIFAFRRLSDLQFPAAGEADLKKLKFLDLYGDAAAADPGFYPELRKIGETGIATVNTMELYYKPGSGLANAGKVEALLLNNEGGYGYSNKLVYSSPLNDDAIGNSRFIRDLRHVAATIRADVGARFFHVRLGGFDSHSSQEDGFYHSFLLRQISDGIAGLYNDMNSVVSLPGGYSGYRTGNLANKILIVTFSEFARTMRQNAAGQNAAGTDHATSAPQFVVGGTVIGGQYGAHAQLANPRSNNKDDLRFTHDFRDLYGEILSRWLGVAVPDLVGPGKIFAQTPSADSDGKSYLAYTPIGFLAP